MTSYDLLHQLGCHPFGKLEQRAQYQVERTQMIQVFHIEKTNMLMLVVEIDVGGMTADVVHKLTCSSDDVQPRRENIQELRVYMKLFQFHIIDIHIVQEQ
nr:hypothetical protein [Tanacetum cinerariifolium]